MKMGPGFFKILCSWWLAAVQPLKHLRIQGGKFAKAGERKAAWMSNDTWEHAQVSGVYNAPKLSVFTTSRQQPAALGLSTGAKNGEAPSRGKWRGKIHSAWIQGSLWAELRHSHHRNRKAGERKAVAQSACRFWQLSWFRKGKFCLCIIHIMCGDLVLWILEPHISCRAFTFLFEVREFIQTVNVYVTYMIYDITYDHRLSDIFLFLCRINFTFWEKILSTQIDIVISTWELGGIRIWQGTFAGGSLRHHFRMNIYLTNLFLSHLYMPAQHCVFWAWVWYLIESTLMGFGVLFPPLYLLSGYLGSLGMNPAVQACKESGREL